MRHRIRRISEILALALLALLWTAGDADAQFNGALRGEYNVSAVRHCATEIVGPAADGTIFPPIAMKGTANFDGSGGVTLIGQAMAPFGPVGTGFTTPSGDQLYLIQQELTSCTGTYTVNGDGTFSQTLNCNLTFTGSINTGDTATLNGIRIRGQLSLDGTVLLLGNTVATPADIETLSCPTCDGPAGPNAGLTRYNICTTTGIATSRR